jgi:hypothetical protein
MDRRVKFGNLMLIFVAILIFAIDNYHATTVQATKDGDSSSSSSSSSSSIIAKDSSFDSTLPLPLPLPFDSHIADVLKNINEPIYSNDLIPFP